MSAFDEQPDGDPHGECAIEINRLRVINVELASASRGALTACEVLQSIAPGLGLHHHLPGLPHVIESLRAALAKAGVA